MSTIRKTGLVVATFSLATHNYLSDVYNAEIVLEVKDAEAKGVADEWDFPWEIAKSWTLNGEIFVATSALLLAAVAGGSAVVAASIDTGTNTYAGNVLLSTIGHKFDRDALQIMRVTGKGQGVLTVTAPS